MKKSNPLFFKALSVVMALAMILSVVSASFAVSAESTEIVLNNKTAITFEDGKFPAGVTGSARGTTSIVAAPAAGHGNYSLKRTYKPELPAEKDNDTSARINVSFKAGHTYKISLYYYFVPNTEEKTNYSTWFTLSNSVGNLYKGTYHDPEKAETYNTWRKKEIEYTFEKDLSYIDLLVSRCDAYFDDINIIDTTAPEEDLYLHTDFSDITTTEWLPLRAGENANLRYVNDAEKGVVAVCDVAKGFSDSNMLYIPKKLEAGKEYIIQMEYKTEGPTDGWSSAFYNGIAHSQNADKNSDGEPMFVTMSTSWTQKTWTISSQKDQYLYFGSTNAVTIYLSKIILREKNNSESKQVYDFDTITLGEVYGTNVAKATASVNNANGMANKAIKKTYPASGKTDIYGALEHALVAGQTYKFSFDYTGEGVVRIFANMRAWSPNQIISKSVPTTEVVSRDAQNYGLKTASGEWKHLEFYFIANDNWNGITFVCEKLGKFTDFAGGTDIYLDNITIENVATYTVALGEYANGTATVSKTSALVGDTVTFSASADIGYTFAGWKDEEGNIVSYDSAYTVTVNSDLTLTPVFEKFKAVKVDFENGSIPADVTSVTLAEDAGKGEYSVKHKAAGGYENVRFKNVKFISGHTYAISFDYKVDSSVPAAQNYWMRLEVKSAADKDVAKNKGLSTAAEYYDKWNTAGWTYTATEDGQYFSILVRDEIYYDNIKIIDLTDAEDTTIDFDGNNDFSLLDISDTSATMVDVEYAEDEEYGKVAVISYNRGFVGGYDAGVILPFTMADGVTYRFRITYKSEGDPNGWFCYSFDGKKGHGSAVGINSADWTEQDWYITGSADQKKLSIGTNAKSATLYIASIEVEIAKGVAGDVDNDGAVIADDLVVMRKLLVGLDEGEAFVSAADVNGDGETDIRDLVRIKKIFENFTLVDEAESLNLLAASQNVKLETSASSLNLLGDGSRFKKAVSGKDGYVIYRISGSITEAAIECDFPVSKLGQFTFEVSDNMNDWTAVVPTAVSAQEINVNSWVRYTYYIGDLDYVSGLKINFPDNDEAGVRKVKINRVDDTVLYSLKGYDPYLRESANFYVDSISGNDSNNGLSAESAFKTLSAAFSRCFVPGDSILLARGGSYKGGVELHSSGSKTAPIKISAYGDGNAPVITDFANKVGLGIWGEYVEISEIEFTCPEGITAIGWYAVKSGASKGAVIKNCYFHHINSTETSTRFASRGTGGVAFYAQGNNPTWFDGAIVENNRFDTLGRDSVYFTSQWACCDTKQGWGDRNLDANIEAVRNRNIAVRNNSITANAGDAILLIGAEDSVIEHNTVANSILIGDRTEEKIAWAAVWYHSSVNCVIQYNEVYGNSGANGGHDLQAFDLDIACRDCIVQYNYSHDNDGGFMLLCGKEAENGGGVSGAVIRYNLSVNDGAKGLSVFDITGSISNSAIYNNTVYCGKNDVKLVNLANYQKVSTLSENTVFTNNIFYAKDGVSVSFGYGDINTAPAFTDAAFNKNVFYNISDPVWSGRITVTDSMNEDPLLTDAGNTGNGFEAGQFYAPQSGSYVLEAGTIIENNGGKDYFGNTVSPQSTLIGAIIV